MIRIILKTIIIVYLVGASSLVYKMYNTKPAPPNIIIEKDNSPKLSTLLAKITMYTPSKKETDNTPNLTASNKKVRLGICAVSRDLFFSGFTFGKTIYIENVGFCEIQDLMNKRMVASIDIFTFKKSEAKQFGVKYKRIRLLD